PAFSLTLRLARRRLLCRGLILPFLLYPFLQRDRPGPVRRAPPRDERGDFRRQLVLSAAFPAISFIFLPIFCATPFVTSAVRSPASFVASMTLWVPSFVVSSCGP